MKHRFTEKTAANRHAVQPARQLAFLPRFHGMRVTDRVQILVTRHDLLIDPGFVTSRARPNHLARKRYRFLSQTIFAPRPVGHA